MGIGYVRVNAGLAGAFAAPGAGANSGNQAIVSPDDNVDRIVTGIMITDGTKGGHTQLFNAQKLVADINHDQFTLTNRYVLLHERFAAGIQFRFTMFNDSTGGLTVNPGVIIRYHTGEDPTESLPIGS